MAVAKAAPSYFKGVGYLSEEELRTEIRAMREDVAEAKADQKETRTDIKEMRSEMAQFRLLLEAAYVKKREFEEYKKEQRDSRRWWATFAVLASGTVSTILTLLWRYFTGGGKAG